MALVHLNFDSKYLSGSTDVNIILPDCARAQDPGPFTAAGKSTLSSCFCTAPSAAEIAKRDDMPKMTFSCGTRDCRIWGQSVS